ncbi:hypothetical protein L1987_74767 [Smallanthus sonchifolius]|uniref:Uncharacterized protein n=1 Tax=Smallanthus sonchifolius TaxID=185202 RepID=A0ACB9A4H6_9ASTR|nr:hypothetical protein L1987_74767 [Smallanthus sonchifolius]
MANDGNGGHKSPSLFHGGGGTRCRGYHLRSVRGLNNAAQSTPDRQTACGCLKGVYASNFQASVASTSLTRSALPLTAPRFTEVETYALRED